MRDPARRVRLLATVLLALMAGLLVLAHWSAAHGWGPPLVWGYVGAFAEAAMVGGLADWFAVTALFRHPLGLPIPHTAIIPVNKDRIADSMASFLRAHFLIPSVVARRLAGLDAAGLAGKWLAREPLAQQDGAAPGLGEGFGNLLADILAALDRERLGGAAKSALSRQIAALDLAPLLGQLLRATIADGRHTPLIEGLIRHAAHVLETNEALLRAMIHDRANSLLRWTRLDERLANGILDGLYAVLAETVVDPDHPLRRKLEEALAGLADDLMHNPAMGERVKRMKAEVLANPAFTAWLDGMWERGRSALIVALRQSGGPRREGSGVLASSLSELGRALRDDAKLNPTVNRFVRRTLTGLANRYGDQIVRLVSDTVRRWDARTVTARIETAVGRDLQFIRINGTLVGGLVGVGLHGLSLLV